MFNSKLASLEARIARLESSLIPQQKSASPVPEVGDFLISKTHYNGTYNWFFEVIGKQGATTLILQHTDSIRKYGDPDTYAEGTEVPAPGTKNRMSNTPFKARWNGSSAKVPYGRVAFLWDGKKQSFQSMD